MGGTNGERIVARNGNPYILDAYYARLEMTPEAENGDYVQFKIGDQSWTTDIAGGVPRFNTGRWSRQWSPAVSISRTGGEFALLSGL